MDKFNSTLTYTANNIPVVIPFWDRGCGLVTFRKCDWHNYISSQLSEARQSGRNEGLSQIKELGGKINYLLAQFAPPNAVHYEFPDGTKWPITRIST